MPAEFTAKQQRFIAEYIRKPIATRAAIKAGYSAGAASVHGSRLLASDKILKEIKRRQAIQRRRWDVELDELVAELLKIARANIDDYITIGSDGQPFIDLTDLEREELAAIGEITVDEYTEGRGDDAREVKRVKIKLHDKQKAIMSIAQLAGFIKHKHEHTGANGLPIETKTTLNLEAMDPEARDQLRALLLSSAAPQLEAAQVTDVEDQAALDDEIDEEDT